VTKPLILTSLTGMPLVRPGDDLAALLRDGLGRAGIRLEVGDILAVTQKVVSKAEGRLVNLAEVQPSRDAGRLAQESHKDPRLVEVILGESRKVLRVRPGLIIVRHRLGFVCANAGVDHSNVAGEGWVLMLPQDPDASARRMRADLERAGGAQLGVLIIDSHGRAWRTGTVGVAIGVAGFPASRSFQFRIALKPRKNVPWVCHRQNGRMANITTWPLPSGASTSWARLDKT